MGRSLIHDFLDLYTLVEKNQQSLFFHSISKNILKHIDMGSSVANLNDCIKVSRFGFY